LKIGRSKTVSTMENNSTSSDSRKRVAGPESEVPAHPEKRIKTATLHADEAETEASASSQEQNIFTNVSVFSRPSDFNESTWGMVDLHHRPHISQGATPLVARCIRVYGWSESRTRKVLKAYRQFLELKKIKGDWNAETLSPSTDVDLMWHQHILDVVSYSHDCMLLCGHVVGHNPDGGLDDEARAERRQMTVAALKEHFGEEVDVTVWSTSEHLENPVEDGEEYPVVDEEDHPVEDEVHVVHHVEDEEESDRVPEEPITVRVCEFNDQKQKNEYTFFRIHRGTRLQRLFRAYALLKHTHEVELRFLLDGERILEDQTAIMLELDDQDLIDCTREQVGC
jgi:hypothetical protein